VYLTRLLKRADFQMLTIVLILCVIGSVAIYSCTKSDMVKAGRSPMTKLKLQLVWLVLGLAALVGTMMMDASKLGRLAVPIYLVCIGLLLVVLVLGPIRGTTRWISLGPLNLQPAELAKLAVILILGSVLARAEEQSWDFLFLVRTLGYVMAPAFLILLQPDLGTPIVLFFVWLVMMFVFGGNPVHLAAFALAAILLFAGAWGFGLIRPHQKQRMISFMDPGADPQGSGYHLRQSLIAIGSGHLWGNGLFHGPQSQGSFIPDQETDFIFTVVGEEMGFVGAVSVVLLYGLLLYRGIAVAAAAPGMFGRVVATGVTAMLLLQVVANIGMTIGVAPVKGMALPFLSYGGSSLVSSMIAVGILQSIYMRRDPIVF
jgi:rod shape determining protein RodA